MKRVLLTGANGFVGRQAILPLLERGYEVHAASNLAAKDIDPKLFFENVIWHQADLHNAVEVENLLKKVQATHLLHFAWYVEHGKFWSSEENYQWVESSFNLLREFHRLGGQRVVISGTCAEYEWGRDTFLVEDKTPLVPSNLYGVCKNNLRQKLFEFAEQNYLSAAWGRMFFLYGPHEPPQRLVASVINSLLRDENANCSHGNQLRDFLYIKDAANGFVALLDNKEAEGCFNIASGQAQTLKEIVLTIADWLGQREKVRFGVISSPADEPQSIVADVTKISKVVGWKPHFNLLQGVQETINWYKHKLD